MKAGERHPCGEIEMVIDRVEGGYAILVTGDGDRVSWPIGGLPPGAGPGMVVRVSIRVDAEGTGDLRKQVKGLLDDLLETST